MQSSAENDDRVITLAREVLLMPASKREEFLRMKCQDQGDLYSQVAEVVEWEERMGGFLSEPLIKYIELEDDSHVEEVFKPGDTISDRFHIMREVGRGGMGIVYEAFDRKRNQRIAIKCAQPGFGRLLSPELEGALKVRHPNICLVNEIHTTKIEHGELDFLTMEYLEGETLAARLNREGKLPPQEALTIARQLCAGVTAAHEAGVLHRDLKPGNVILTRNEDGSTRAVITDFGLATEARLESDLEGGTPRYMAPELLDGEKPSKASDVYALGVILYEMATGQAPFSEKSAHVAVTRSPSEVNHELDSRWDKAVFPCLQTAPAERRAAADVLKSFDARPLWKSPVLVVAVLALVISGTGFWPRIAGYFKPAEIRVAMLPVETSADMASFAEAASKDVADRVQRSGGRSILVIPPLLTSGKHVQTPEQAKEQLQATHAVQLKFTREGNDIAVEESVVELKHQTRVRLFRARYSPFIQKDLPRALADAAIGSLHLPHHDSPETISAAALTAYDQANSLLNLGDQNDEAAIESFRTAARLDPHSGLPLAGLAEAELMRFQRIADQRWLDAALSDVDRAESLNPDSVLVLLARGMVETQISQPEHALEVYRRAEELEPDNVEVLLRTAAIYELQNLPEPALRYYRRAVAAGPKLWKPYLDLGLFFYMRGDYASAATQFESAAALEPNRYELYGYLAATRAELGDYVSAEQAFTRSLTLRKTAWALCGLGALKESEGHDEEAVAVLRESTSLDPYSATCLLNLGDALRRTHEGARARAAYRSALNLTAAEVRNNPRRGFPRSFVGYLAARLGDRGRAIDETEEALHLFPEDTKVLRRAILTYEALGDRARSIKLAEKVPVSVLQELARHPDLRELSQDSRFIAMLEQLPRKGE